MTFDELLAQFAPQTQAAWAQLAAAEWRGAPPEHFDLTLGREPRKSGETKGPAIPPFFSTAPGEADSTQQPALGLHDSPSTDGWTMLSDLRMVGEFADPNRDISLGDLLLEELAGGAEGAFISLDRVHELTSAAASLRFDLTQLHLVREGDEDHARALLEPLSRLIPVDQSAGVALRLPFSGVVEDEAVRLLARFPKLRWTMDVAGIDAPAIIADFRRRLTQMLADDRQDARHLCLPRMAIRYPAPVTYVEGVALPAAIRQVWEQVLNQSAVSGNPGLPELLTTILPGASPTREAYLIDATVRLTAAVSGGVDAALVAPFANDERARREARNVQQVLRLESSLGAAREAVRGASFFQAAVATLADLDSGDTLTPARE